MLSIVFVLRGCSAGWLGAYGNEWVATPHLDQFASEAVVFNRHISDCPTPEAARRAWRSGRHQVPPHANSPAPPVANLDLQNELHREKVRTILIRANYPDTDVPGFAEGGSEVIDARPQAEDASPLGELIRVLPSILDTFATDPRGLIVIEIDRLIPPWDIPQDVFEVYLDEYADDDDEEDNEVHDANEPADEDEDEPSEAGISDEDNDEDDEAEDESPLEPEETVTPWTDPPTGPFDRDDLVAWEWLHTSFSALVTTLDSELGQLFEVIVEHTRPESTAVIITSDTGWPLGEHGQIGSHRPWLHEELIHLPLIVKQPGTIARRIEAWTQPADLMPTLFELCTGSSMGGDLHGVSLVPLAKGIVASTRLYAVSGMTIAEAAEWALLTDEWKYLSPQVSESEPSRSPRLFAKPEDRWDVNDVRQHHLEWVAHLEDLLWRAVSAIQESKPLVLPELKSRHDLESE